MWGSIGTLTNSRWYQAVAATERIWCSPGMLAVVLSTAACFACLMSAGNVNAQVAEVCRQLEDMKELRGGFNMVGFSQGGQFLRVSGQGGGVRKRNGGGSVKHWTLLTLEASLAWCHCQHGRLLTGRTVPEGELWGTVLRRGAEVKGWGRGCSAAVQSRGVVGCDSSL